RRDGTGQVFGSSTGFNLPNGATRSPDVAWVRNERLDALTDEQWHKFLPLCPDFVLELRSPSDSVRVLQDKMEEYRENGARLARWSRAGRRRDSSESTSARPMRCGLPVFNDYSRPRRRRPLWSRPVHPRCAGGGRALSDNKSPIKRNAQSIPSPENGHYAGTY